MGTSEGVRKGWTEESRAKRAAHDARRDAALKDPGIGVLRVSGKEIADGSFVDKLAETLAL